MQTHLVIPARLKSTRLPSKPLLLVHGVPLVLRVAQQAKDIFDRTGMFASWQVATDSASIADLCRQYQVPVVLTRDDHPSGTDRLAEVATLCGWPDDDMVVNLQGDEPLVPDALILQVAALLASKPDCVMATLYEPITTLEEFQRPSAVKVVCTAGQEALYFSRAPIPFARDNPDILPPDARRHLGLYAYRVQLLKDFTNWPQTPLEQLESLEQLRVLENGYRIAIDQATLQLPAGVDTPEDLARLNALPATAFPPFILQALKAH